MSTSLASLISNVKSNTAKNSLLQKNLAINKKRSASHEDKTAIRKKLKQEKPAIESSEPKVVVFDGSSLKKRPEFESRKEKKAFLSGKILQTDSSSTEDQSKMSAKEVAEEEENKRNDQELKDLLATSKLLEEYQIEEMSGKERRKHMMNKLETLGAKPAANIRIPLAIHLGMEAKKKERLQQKMQEAKDTGLYDKSLKHLYVKTKAKKRDRNPGITNGIGRMKGATLQLSKEEITRVARQGTKSKSGGKKGKGKRR
ncbi:uncharacterized protein BYT42DRAFT_631526 [Radiomyces spectabilis]|uniref:uncharacterized protein n=1 Tax=Radiomyces spectabilis TaxID=64574 RepID=UPI002220D10D|nr:uncharacterized protein BYT42DRAFT_631526 [Radiomyces spectabilis]KAI8388525.1 hypothetical protein BYT42DRAFT_631526 [Radiomyces spectabilis]